VRQRRASGSPPTPGGCQLDAAARLQRRLEEQSRRDTEVYRVEPDSHRLQTTCCSAVTGTGRRCASGLHAGRRIESFDGGKHLDGHPPKRSGPEREDNDILFTLQSCAGYWRQTRSGSTATAGKRLLAERTGTPERPGKVTTNNMGARGHDHIYTKRRSLYAAGSPSLMRKQENGAT